MPLAAPDGHQHQHQTGAVPAAAAAAAAATTTTIVPARSDTSNVPTPRPPQPQRSVTSREALRHSFNVGLSGGGATVFSVATMMWLHTIITYQQRHGTTFADTCKTLWRAGGPRRFYRGLIPSLMAAPLCRFGDTLSNELAMVWFNGQRTGSSDPSGNCGKPVPVWVATFLGSMGAAAFHAVFVPLDTYKVREVGVGGGSWVDDRGVVKLFFSI